MIKTLVGAILCLTLSNTSQAENAPPFHAVGDLTLKAFKSSGESWVDKELKFDVWVKGSEWQIRLYEEPLIYDAVGSDGSNVYFYRFNDDFMRKNPTHAHILPGRITGGAIPLDTGSRISVLWFAFCSGPYLQQHEKYCLIPWSSPRTDLTRTFAETSLTISSSPPFLPVSGDFYLSAEAKARSLAQDWIYSVRKIDAERALARFPDGFCVGTFQANEFLKQEGQAVPSLVEVKEFGPPKPPKLPKAWLSSSYKIKVTAIDTQTLESYPPTAPAGFIITPDDTRLRNPSKKIDFIKIRIQDGIWPKEPTAEAIRELAELSATPFSPMAQNEKFKFTRGLLLFVLMVGGPTLFYTFSLWQKKRRRMQSR